ncbi:TPA: hypothetical protein SLN67_002608 [Serratia marcescens]|nr:hypothetical protein [Serratia marcescens]
MDNKLSELSKPISYDFGLEVLGKMDFSGDEEAMRDYGKQHGGKPLYSQEYVSALLARIAELESDLSEWTDCKHDGATWYDFGGRERCGHCGSDV